MTVGIIMAAGTGNRFKSEIPKQFCMLGDKPVINYCLKSFEKSHLIDNCLIMVPTNWQEEVKKMIEGFRKPKWVLPGGATRHETSLIALEFLRDINPSVVVFHDAARPFLRVKLLNRVIEEAHLFGAATAAIPVNDTVVYAKDMFVNNYLSREGLYRIQTPQAFAFEIALNAFERFHANDGTEPVLLSGGKVRIVPGDLLCFKITYPDDLQFARFVYPTWNELD
ncbi:IspD/TarI family cytidylyltransferase [Pseudothermotoga elfii]